MRLRLPPEEAVAGKILRDLQIRQVRTAYRHPETKGRLERYHLTLKDATERLECYTSPAGARAALERFVYEYTTQRPRQALEYVTPASVHFGYANELRALRRHQREQANLLRCRPFARYHRDNRKDRHDLEAQEGSKAAGPLSLFVYRTRSLPDGLPEQRLGLQPWRRNRRTKTGKSRREPTYELWHACSPHRTMDSGSPP